jgi:hypothetical protein
LAILKISRFSDEALSPRKVLTELVQRRMQFSFDDPLRSRICGARFARLSSNRQIASAA